MKLSHLLITLLAASSITAIAQNESKVKKQKTRSESLNSSSKTSTATKKKYKEKTAISAQNLKTDTIILHPKFHCPACGRG
jgi:hypothetical protein